MSRINASARVPGPLVAVHRDAVDRRDVDRRADRVLADVPRGRHDRVPALQGRDRELVAAADEVLEQRQDPAVDLPGLDVLAPALVDLEARVVEDALGELLLGEQQDLADRVAVRRERVLVGHPVERRCLEQLPAVEDRLRVDRGRAAARGPDREVDVGGERVAVADAAEQGAGDDLGALPQRAQLHGLAVELQDPAGVRAEALEVREVAEQRVVEAAAHAARVVHRRPDRRRAGDPEARIAAAVCPGCSPAPRPSRLLASVAGFASSLGSS